MSGNLQKVDLVPERIAIESCRKIAQEEEHAEDLVDLLEDLPKD